MTKRYMKTYADAHNHLNGIISVEAIKAMMSEARREWDKNQFSIIPSELIPNAQTLSFSNTSITNDYGWIDCLDVLSRLIVFSALDIKKRADIPSSKAYHNTVKDLLFIRDGDQNQGSGRGMNAAGLLLSGCIALRSILDRSEDGIKDAERYFQHLRNLHKSHDAVTFEDMFITACLLDVDKEINQDNWLFNKFKMENLDPELHALAEQIAISCTVSSLAASLWVPFDDSYALRSLITRGNINKRNYLMLTMRWLLENEAIRGNYFVEVSINVGDLGSVYNIIKNNAVDFGFKAVTTGGVDATFTPLVLENSETRTDLLHSNKLFIRFLTGSLNSLCVRSDADIDKVLARDLELINQDKIFGCFAGIDMFGVENFVYDREKLTKWLTTMYKTLRDINKEGGKARNLWLRPHVGEGAWAEDLRLRIKKYDGNPLSLAKKLKTLSEFFSKNYTNETKVSSLHEVLEFIYRSIFTGWLPIDDVRRFYGVNSFSVPELSRLSSLLQPFNPNNGSIGEKIGEANLEIMIDWVNFISASTIEAYDKYYPQIRCGHGSHLGFDSVWGIITDLQNVSFTNIWVDLNLGSNVVTAAKPISYMTHSINLKECPGSLSSTNSLFNEILNKSRFTCGYIQTETVERSERIAKFIALLNKHGIKFVLGTDGQGTELTSLFGEQLHFKNLMHWYYEDSNEAELMNKRLKNNTFEYIKYGLSNLQD